MCFIFSGGVVVVGGGGRGGGVDEVSWIHHARVVVHPHDVHVPLCHVPSCNGNTEVCEQGHDAILEHCTKSFWVLFVSSLQVIRATPMTKASPSTRHCWALEAGEWLSTSQQPSLQFSTRALTFFRVPQPQSHSHNIKSVDCLTLTLNVLTTVFCQVHGTH